MRCGSEPLVFLAFVTLGDATPNYKLGLAGNQTLFLVIQHSDLKTQEQYLPMMREAVKDGNADPGLLALLEDRVALQQGKRQTYGSQIGQNNNGEYYVMPLEDPDNVDKRRAEVGLEPLQNYLANWGLSWDAEAYRKKLPEIEKNKGARHSPLPPNCIWREINHKSLRLASPTPQNPPNPYPFPFK